MVKKSVISVIVAVLLILIAAIAFLSFRGLRGNNNPSQSTSVASLLQSKKWHLELVDNTPATQAANIEFKNDGKVVGFAGCNEFGGDYELSGWQVRLTEFVTTLMACPDMEAESKMLTMLKGTVDVELNNGRLTLQTDGGQLVFNENINVTSRISGKWGFRKFVAGTNSRNLVKDTSIIVDFTAEGQITGEACNLLSSNYEIGDRRTIKINEVAATRKFCTQPNGIMEQEAEFITALKNASSFVIESANTLRINYSDTEYLEFARIVNTAPRAVSLGEARSVSKLESSAASVDQGKPVEFSIQVQPNLIEPRAASNTPPAVSGNVALFSGDQQIAAPVKLTNPKDLSGVGIAQVSLSDISAGAYAIVAKYNGDSTYMASTSNPVPLTVNGASGSNTSTAINASKVTISQGDNITFTATVTGEEDADITGQIDFFDGNTLLGSVLLDNSDKAAYSTKNLTIGSHSITARYNGNDDNNASISQPVVVAVNTPLVGAVLNLSTSSQKITVNSKVTFTLKATGDKGTPTGNIGFYEGSKLLGNVTLDSKGVAELSVTNLSVGNRTVVAKYAGNKNYKAGDSNSIKMRINPPLVTTHTTVVTTRQNFTTETPLEVNVSVSSDNNAIVSGTVSLLDNDQQIAILTLDNAGKARYVDDNVSAGLHTISANYLGNDVFKTSNANAVSILVSDAPTIVASAVSLSVNKNELNQGDALMLTAKVTSASGNNTPTGAVTFEADGVQIGFLQLDASGSSVATVSNLSSGSHSIAARYSGDDNHGPSNSAPITIRVLAADSTDVSDEISSPQYLAMLFLLLLVVSGISGATVFYLVRSGNAANKVVATRPAAPADAVTPVITK